MGWPIAVDMVNENRHTGFTMKNTETNTVGGTDIMIRMGEDRPGYRACRREERYAHHQTEDGCPVVTLTINLSDDGESFYVRWSTNKGNGWGKAYRKSGFTTEAAAREFANGKWATMLAWVATVAPKASTWQADFTTR